MISNTISAMKKVIRVVMNGPYLRAVLASSSSILSGTRVHSAVAVKLKPDSIGGKSALCRIYLTLAEKLQADAAYTVVPHGINTRHAELP